MYSPSFENSRSTSSHVFFLSISLKTTVEMNDLLLNCQITYALFETAADMFTGCTKCNFGETKPHCIQLPITTKRNMNSITKFFFPGKTRQLNFLIFMVCSHFPKRYTELSVLFVRLVTNLKKKKKKTLAEANY